MVTKVKMSIVKTNSLNVSGYATHAKKIKNRYLRIGVKSTDAIAVKYGANLIASWGFTHY